MTNSNSKQYGVWMDSHHATLVGREHIENGAFIVLGHFKNKGAEGNSSENAMHHQEQQKMHTFFKEITHLMPNATEVYITGTGKTQEQFKHYLADTPQFKHTATTESTSVKMSDEALVKYFSTHFNRLKVSF